MQFVEASPPKSYLRSALQFYLDIIKKRGVSITIYCQVRNSEDVLYISELIRDQLIVVQDSGLANQINSCRYLMCEPKLKPYSVGLAV